MLRLSSEISQHFIIVDLSGELVRDSVEDLRAYIIELLDGAHKDIVLDFHGLLRIDSQGLELLVWLRDYMSDHLGQLAIIKCPSIIETILVMTRLCDSFLCLETIDDIKSEFSWRGKG